MEQPLLLFVLFTVSAATFPDHAAGAADRYPNGLVLASRSLGCAQDPHIRDHGQGTVNAAGFVSSLNNRTRAIQISIVLMCVALLILMKKFADTGP